MIMLLAICLIAVVAAAPPVQQRINYSPNEVRLLKYDFDNIGLGDYRFYYEQTDGQRQEQVGEVKNQGREDESLAVHGSYQWVGPDGVTYTVNYTADEEGYKPEIEQGPGGGVPPAVVASLLG